MSSQGRASALLIVLSLTSLLGCPEPLPPESEVALVQITGAPPTLTAELVDTDERRDIRLSAGVAMAVGCWGYCVNPEGGWGHGGACERVTVTTDDDAVLEVRRAYRRTGEPTFVLSGAQRGSARVTIATACATKTYRAVVE